ncbi:MAG: hypothetical protein LBG70_01820, partial [Bifidobacteriaceae bacterium]|nr:hypothetical protein [Bifidobacteriaceae bacterium]
YPYIMWLFLGGKHGFNVILIRNRDDGFQDSHTFGYGPSAETVNPLDPRPHWHYNDNRLIQ